jgi:hypothetical protein
LHRNRVLPARSLALGETLTAGGGFGTQLVDPGLALETVHRITK